MKIINLKFTYGKMKIMYVKYQSYLNDTQLFF